MPFLVTHAALVWKVVLAGFVVLGAIAFLIVRRVIANRAMRAEVRALDASKDPGLVRGTFGGGIATTLHTLSPYRIAAEHSERAPELWIETADGRVVLHGEITVIAGARSFATRGGLPRQASRALATVAQTVANTGPASARLLRVRPGDEVIARGTLGREAATDGTDYRSNALQLTLAGPITLAARHWRGAQPRPSWIALAALACVLTFVGYETLDWIGEAFDDRCIANGDLELSNHNACVIANALPTRRVPLNHLRDALDREPVTSAAVLERHLAVARLVEDCPSLIRRVEEVGHPDLALAEALRCNDISAEEAARIEAGQFDEAVALDVPLDHGRDAVRLSLLVMGHGWRRAALLLEKQAAAIPDIPGDQERIDLKRTSMRCTAALFAFYADGSMESVARIQELAAGPHGGPCAVALAESTGKPLGSIVDTSSRALALARQLAGDGPEPSLGTTEALLQSNGVIDQLSGPSVWATALSPVPPATAPATARFSDASHRMILQIMLGDLAAARAQADVAIPFASDPTTHFEYDAQFVTLFHPMIALYSTDTSAPVPPSPTDSDPLKRLWSYLVPNLALRHGDAPVAGDRRGALEAAARGDAAKLVAAIRDGDRIAPLEVIAVLPRITAHRAELVALLPWMHHDDRLDGYGFPFGTAHQLATRRTMFTLAGDTAEAAAAASAFQRYATVFHDRRVLISLALLADQ